MDIETHDTHTAIIRDGLAVAVVPNADVLAWFRREHSFSMHHALEFEGYALETRHRHVIGWMAIRQNVERRGYGVPGALSRLAAALQDTVAAYTRDTAGAIDHHPSPAEFDAYAAAHIAPMLDAFTGLLSHTGMEPAPSFDFMRGELAAWATGTAARMGVEL